MIRRRVPYWWTGLAVALVVVVTALVLLNPLERLTRTARAEPVLRAVATLGVFADFARQVGGDRVAVAQLVPDGEDVHGFQFTPGALAAVQRAQVFVYNGLQLEPFVPQVLAAAGQPGLRHVVLAEGLPPIVRDGQPNPHFWLDPRLAVHYVERIRDGFAAADPAGAATYEANAAQYVATLRALDAELEAQLSTVPPERRKLIVTHDAFSYFARRYGFEEIAAILSTEGQEPGPGEYAALLRQVRQAGVPTLFTEPQLPSRAVQQFAREAGLRLVPLYSDAFPADGSIRSYVDLMRANVRNIVEGLR